jgi:hypothetical protein
VPPASHQQAEVGSRPADGLLGVGRAELPHRTRRGGKNEAEGDVGRLHPARLVTEVPGPYREEGQMADAVGVLALHAQRVGDVLPVSEQLHHPGRGQHRCR